MTPSETPVVRAIWTDARWLVDLEDGTHEARDDREAAELIERHCPGAAVRWVLPVLAVELVTEPAVEP